MVVLGVVVLGVEVGDEVVWDVNVRGKNSKLIRMGRRVLWLRVFGGGKSLIGVIISLGLVKISFEVIRI